MAVLRDFFIGLSQIKPVNDATKKMGLRFGAQHVVGGTKTDDTVEKIRQLNQKGLSITVDNLGEFIEDRAQAEIEKNLILDMIDAIHKNHLDAHFSVKLTQLGLNLGDDFILQNMREIMEAAKKADNMFVNIDMENYASKEKTFFVLDELLKDYDNVGTVLQAYLFDSMEDAEKYKDNRTRLVKGAYKEDPSIAYQSKNDIDNNYFDLIKYHLTHGKGFTSIATHDHNIINRVIDFVEANDISHDSFEFQMLYGFRNDYQLELVEEGYNMTVYVPYGNDWYAYFMRRLAERPQNLNLLVKSVTTNKKFKVGAAAAAAVGAGIAVTKLFKK
ncbi:proline dehydrogenase family protein [Nosocomiicoccus sp. HMSC059G07]|uniref:proline dehydrogenase family protein n=1 Tax=Nosocomiicoccus sp. HMSC059G07 TaxID=1739531 RepID=UPI0008A1C0C4|nr:proline dehydrogenase family protein [Nosocomiicoccus sp. HMSC059G07]OFO53750.1 proline dehydrogenase [Nosocomiicoccus sp. HMSC059G07]